MLSSSGNVSGVDRHPSAPDWHQHAKWPAGCSPGWLPGTFLLTDDWSLSRSPAPAGDVAACSGEIWPEISPGSSLVITPTLTRASDVSVSVLVVARNTVSVSHCLSCLSDGNSSAPPPFSSSSPWRCPLSSSSPSTCRSSPWRCSRVETESHGGWGNILVRAHDDKTDELKIRDRHSVT